MKGSIKIPLVCFLVLGLMGALPAPEQMAASSPTVIPTIPLQVNGSVSIQVRPYGTILSPTILLKGSGRPLSRAVVEVDGKRIPETTPGRYHNAMKGFKAATGKPLKVKMDPQPSPSVKIPSVTGTATIGRLLSFASPAPEAKIKLASTPNLHISWNAVGGPVHCHIYMINGNSVGNGVYHKTNISGNSIMVNTRVLVPNQKYGIYLLHRMGQFSLTGPTTANSRLSLSQSRAIYFYTL